MVIQMNELETLQNKWANVRETREVANFDYAKLVPGNFCLHVSDTGGPPPCRTTVQGTGFFDDALDALSYYRFAEIPRILHWDSRVRTDEIQEADFYLSKYDDDKKRSIVDLLQLIDEALISVNISKEQLGVIRVMYNDLFSKTEPENQILAWGSLGEILRSSCFDEGFKENIEEEADMEPDDKYSTMLKELLNTGSFDESNNEHLDLARYFLEGQFFG